MDAIIHSIEVKCAELLGVSIESVEQLQIVRYTKGQHFGLHHDAGTLKRFQSMHLPQLQNIVSSCDSVCCNLSTFILNINV